MPWKQVWSNGKYTVSLYITYSQDVVANTTTVTVTNQQCCSLDAYHYFYNVSVNNGYQFLGGENYDVYADVRVNAGSCWQFPQDHVISHTYTHDANGNPPTMTVYAQWISGIDKYDTPEFDWTYVNLTSLIPAIDRSASTCSASLVSTTTNSATLKLTSNVAITKGCYTIDNGSTWNYFDINISANGSANYTVTGLSPSTTYTIKVQLQKPSNGVWSNTASVSATTKDDWVPVTPANVRVTPVLVTPTLFQIRVTNDIDEHDEWYKVKYQVTNGPSGESNEYSTSIASTKGALLSFTKLMPNATYTVTVTVISNFSKTSDPVAISITTTRDQATIFVKSANQWNLSYLFYKQNGAWIPVYALYYKQNDVWTPIPRFWDT